MTLGHLADGLGLRIGNHNRSAVDIDGDVPAESLIEQVVLGGGGQVFAASDHMGDAHEVVVNDVGEVIGGQSVGLNEHLIVQVGVVHGHIAIDGVVEGGVTGGDLLTDDVGFPSGQLGVDLLLAQVAAVAVVFGHFALGGSGFPQLFQALLGAEAAIGQALFHQQLGVFLIIGHPLGLDIGANGAAHVGAFVVVQVAALHGALDDGHSVLYLPLLVGILDAQDEFALVVAGDEVGVEGGAQVAHMHIAGGRGGKPSANLALGDACFHIFKPLII